MSMDALAPQEEPTGEPKCDGGLIFTGHTDMSGSIYKQCPGCPSCTKGEVSG